MELRIHYASLDNNIVSTTRKSKGVQIQLSFHWWIISKGDLSINRNAFGSPRFKWVSWRLFRLRVDRHGQDLYYGCLERNRLEESGHHPIISGLDIQTFRGLIENGCPNRLADPYFIFPNIPGINTGLAEPGKQEHAHQGGEWRSILGGTSGGTCEEWGTGHEHNKCRA